MRAMLSLAFVAFAQAAIIAVPEAKYIVPEPHLQAEFPISPMHVRSMIYKYGLEKPAFDEEYVAFSNSLGLVEPEFTQKLRSIYDEPAVTFFVDREGDVISYYADSGINLGALTPEIRSVFVDLLSSADSFAVAYNPESFLEYPQSVSGRFFHPIKDASLSRFLPLKEEPELFHPERSIVFQRPEISAIFPQLRYYPARFDFDELPYAYKSPVALKFDQPIISKSEYYKPYSYVNNYPLAKAVYPFAQKSYPVVNAQYPITYAPSFYKYDLPHSPQYAKHELPSYRTPYITHEFPYAKSELLYKHQIPYARSEIPYYRSYAKYEVPYVKFQPTVRFQGPHVYAAPTADKEYIVAPEEYYKSLVLKAPFIKPLTFEKIAAAGYPIDSFPAKEIKSEIIQGPAAHPPGLRILNSLGAFPGLNL